MSERCCQFGPDQRLAGILTEPDELPRVGCVLISAGLLPKHGPFRLYAELARRLVDAGFVSLRFDLGGIGDSPAERGGRPLRARTSAEIAAAVGHLLTCYPRLDGVALCGLCSGAEDAFRAAAGDRRVDRVVLLDPFAYRTREFRWRHAAHRLWRRVLRVLGVYQPLRRAEGGAGRAVRYEYMTADESRPLLRTLVARGAKVHFLYTAGMRESFNHPGQLRAQFAGITLGELVTVDYLPRVDHTQLLSDDRRSVVETVYRRLR